MTSTKSTSQAIARQLLAGPAPANPSPPPPPLDADPVPRRRGKTAGGSTAAARSAAKDYQAESLRIRGVDGHITHSRDELIAWFVEPPTAWSMRSIDKREKRINARALRMAELLDHGVSRVHQRVVHRPWPVQDWARDFDQWAHSGATAPPADVPDAMSWSDFVVGEQHAQLRRPATSKSVYWGLTLSRRSQLASMLEQVTGAATWAGPLHRLLGRALDGVLDRELADLHDELRDLSTVMSGFGIQAQPATNDQMEWLLWRSATLGLPAPRLASAPNGTWDLSDLAALVDAADVTAEPLSGCVQVRGVINGRPFTRYVAILTLGRMGDLTIPEQHLPWQVWGDGIGAVEQSGWIDLPSQDAVRRKLDRQISRITNQEKHITEEHDLPCPPDLADKVERATLIKNEIESDHTRLATRVEGWWRFAVSGLTADEALHAAEDLRTRYAPTINLELAAGQYQQYYEFFPHEPLSGTAHRRKMSVRLAAAGFASVTDRLGDRHGPTIGETASLSRRPVNWDMWFAQEILDKSGLTPVVGGLGSGKTHLCGMCVYKAVRSGAHGIVLDPSGPLRKLATLPELAPVTRLIDLMDAPPGTLNPYRVIIDPQRDDYPPGPTGDAQWESDQRATAAERKTFVADILRMLLPWDMQQAPAVRRAMDKAVDAAGGAATQEPGAVIVALEQIAGDDTTTADTREAAEDTARKLNELRPHRQVRLLFPQPGIDGWADLTDARLTILTMPGVQLPKLEAGDPGTWSLPQRLGVPLLHLASWLTHRLIYEVPREVRKIVFFDEGKYLSGSGAGQMLYARLERDTRKYNVRALIASQLPDDFLALPGFEALTHEVIIGSLDGERVQTAALQLLRLDAAEGWQDLLESLNSDGGARELTHDPDVLSARGDHVRPREYLMRIGDDVEIIRVDYDDSEHLAHVIAALNSKPTAERARARTDPS